MSEYSPKQGVEFRAISGRPDNDPKLVNRITVKCILDITQNRILVNANEAINLNRTHYPALTIGFQSSCRKRASCVGYMVINGLFSV